MDVTFSNIDNVKLIVSLPRKNLTFGLDPNTTKNILINDFGTEEMTVTYQGNKGWHGFIPLVDSKPIIIKKQNVSCGSEEIKPLRSNQYSSINTILVIILLVLCSFILLSFLK